MKVADNSGKLPLLPCRCKQTNSPKKLIRHQKATITIHQNIYFYPEDRGKIYVRNITFCSEDEGCRFLGDGLFTKVHGVVPKEIKFHLTASIGAPVLVQRDGPHHRGSGPFLRLLLFSQLLPSIFVKSVLLQQASLAPSPEVSYIPARRSEFAQ